jgi:hypothetical protein
MNVTSVPPYTQSGTDDSLPDQEQICSLRNAVDRSAFQSKALDAAIKSETTSAPSTQRPKVRLSDPKNLPVNEPDQVDEPPPSSFFFRATQLLQSTALQHAARFGYTSASKTDFPSEGTEIACKKGGPKIPEDHDAVNVETKRNPHVTSPNPEELGQPSSGWPSSTALWNWMSGAGANLKGNRPVRCEDEDNPVTISRPARLRNVSVISATIRTPQTNHVQLARCSSGEIQTPVQEEPSIYSIPRPEVPYSAATCTTGLSRCQTEGQTSIYSMASLKSMHSSEALSIGGNWAPSNNLKRIMEIEKTRTSTDMLELLGSCIQHKTMSLTDQDMSCAVVNAHMFDLSHPAGSFVRSFGLLIFLHTQINYYALESFSFIRPTVTSSLSLLAKTDDVIDGCDVTAPKRLALGYADYLGAKLIFLEDVGRALDGNYAITRHLIKSEMEHMNPVQAVNNRAARARLLEMQALESMIMLLNSIKVLLTALGGNDTQLARSLSGGGVTRMLSSSGLTSQTCTDAIQLLEASDTKSASIEIAMLDEMKDVVTFYMIAEALYLSQAIRCLVAIHGEKATTLSSKFDMILSDIVTKVPYLAEQQKSKLHSSWTEDKERGDILFDMSRLLGGNGAISIRHPKAKQTGQQHVPTASLEDSMPSSLASTVACRFSSFGALHMALGEAIDSAARCSGSD